ncbi:MAG TPA: hypothetical protein VEK08_04695 [Planctomycetota bacterium]|nr:hypothetical protein [Planctomycetota bacterium]
MNVAQRKLLNWTLFAIGGGGLVTFVVLCLSFGPPPTAIWLLWPLISLGICTLCGSQLLRDYRHDPVPGRGPAQLSLTDLLATAFLIGVLLAFGQKIKAGERLADALVCLLIGVIFLSGLLLASRRGIDQWRRFVFAAGYGLRLFGALGCGALVSTIIAMLIADVPLTRVLRDILFTDERSSRALFYMRYALVALPAGMIACYVADVSQEGSDLARVLDGNQTSTK